MDCFTLAANHARRFASEQTGSGESIQFWRIRGSIERSERWVFGRRWNREERTKELAFFKDRPDALLSSVLNDVPISKFYQWIQIIIENVRIFWNVRWRILLFGKHFVFDLLLSVFPVTISLTSRTPSLLPQRYHPSLLTCLPPRVRVTKKSFCRDLCLPVYLSNVFGCFVYLFFKEFRIERTDYTHVGRSFRICSMPNRT